MSIEGRSADAEGFVPFAGLAERPSCPRCGGFLRAGHEGDEDNPHGLCDPCADLVSSCAPFAGQQTSFGLAEIAGPAPADVNVLELAAGLLLVHDALHRGEPMHLRDALLAYGVELDNVAAHKIVNKLRRRHGMVIHGESRVAGYALEDWTYVASRRRSSLSTT